MKAEEVLKKIKLWATATISWQCDSDFSDYVKGYNKARHECEEILDEAERSLDELLAFWTPERCKAWFAIPENREAQRRSWCVGEIMIERPDMTEAEANKLYDEAVLCALQADKTNG